MAKERATSFAAFIVLNGIFRPARHKDAGAVEKIAPRVADAPDSVAPNSTEPARTPNRVFAANPPAGATRTSAAPAAPKEVLVIASRLKDYITARSEMNTSGSVMDVLSEHLRVISDRAIENARAAGRKTVMDRDFDFLLK